MSLVSGNVNQKEYGDNARDAHADNEGGSYSAQSGDHVMSTPVPELEVSIATPMNYPEQNMGFNREVEKTDHDEKDVMQTTDNANDEHAPASGQAAKNLPNI